MCCFNFGRQDTSYPQSSLLRCNFIFGTRNELQAMSLKCLIILSKTVGFICVQKKNKKKNM